MFSHNLTLSQFVCSIPICQPEADLGSILHIFHQTGCDYIAILRQNGSWGTISSSQLLALLANPRQKLSTITSGYPQKTFDSENSAFETSKAKLEYAIEPAIVYQSDTGLPEFLKSLADNYSKLDRSKYLIVNSAGKLAGKLDKDKLLRYIGSRVERHNPASSLPTSSTPLLSLLDNLTLPIKIETVEQKSCYENRCWQELISLDRDNYLTEVQELSVSIANWWVKKQLAALEKNPNQQQQTNAMRINKSGDFCSLGDRYNNSARSDVRLSATGLSTQQPSSEYPQKLAMSLLDDLPCNRVHSVALDIQVEAGTDWHYIKIPLTLKEESITQTTSHWLILAIKSSFFQSGDRQTNDGSAIARSTTDRLLATICHELKSPLTGILGLSSLLNTQKLGELNRRQAEYIKLIHNSGQKLMAIVNDSIELTNLTTGRFELQPEEIDLEALFHGLYQQVIVKFQAMDLVESDLLILTSGIELNIEPGLETAIADRLSLSSILLHLMLETVQCSNASSIAIKIEVKSEREYTQIVIKNRPEDPKTYLSENSDRVEQDIGLNSIIAKYLAQSLRGDIESVYSSTGCKFILRLPIIDSPTKISSNSAEILAKNHDSAKNLTILCLYPETEMIDPDVENNHSSDFDLKKWAEQDWFSPKQQEFAARHRIIEANGLEQAHTLARIWQLDVIILDGYQIIDPEQYWRSLQESQYLSTLPIVTLDAKTTEAANQIKGLNVYPCLLPAQCRSIQDLMQVIQIATEQ